MAKLAIASKFSQVLKLVIIHRSAQRPLNFVILRKSSDKGGTDRFISDTLCILRLWRSPCRVSRRWNPHGHRSGFPAVILTISPMTRAIRFCSPPVQKIVGHDTETVHSAVRP